MLNFCLKVKSVQESWKCKILLQIQKVPKKFPAQSGNAYFLAQIFKILAGELRYQNTEPVLRARTPITTYTRTALSQKISRSCKGSWVRIKENKPKGKNMNKKTITKLKKMCKENENGHIAIQTHTLTTFYERNQLQDHWARLPLNN